MLTGGSALGSNRAFAPYAFKLVFGLLNFSVCLPSASQFRAILWGFKFKKKKKYSMIKIVVYCGCKRGHNLAKTDFKPQPQNKVENELIQS